MRLLKTEKPEALVFLWAERLVNFSSQKDWTLQWP